MEDRHLYRGKRTLTDNMWVYWDGFSGVQPNTVIEEETICQCTGLKDKNGKLIWENDILSGHIDDEFPEDETRKRVVWHENGWCTNGRYTKPSRSPVIRPPQKGIMCVR